MTKTKTQQDYSNLVAFLTKEVKKSIRPFIRKIIKEEVKYAFDLINETKGYQPITSTSPRIKSTTPSTTSEILGKYNGSEAVEKIVPKTIRVGNVDVPIDTPQNQNTLESNGIHLTGHEHVAMDDKAANFAVNIQTKDYSAIMNKILKKDSK